MICESKFLEFQSISICDLLGWLLLPLGRWIVITHEDSVAPSAPLAKILPPTNADNLIILFIVNLFFIFKSKVLKSCSKNVYKTYKTLVNYFIKLNINIFILLNKYPQSGFIAV